MSEFEKLPVKIQAMRITEKTEIKTREGTLFGYPGEWIITGIEGEVYPCGDEIFKKTYKPTGKDKCQYCKFGLRLSRPCDGYEICVFEWDENPTHLTDITIGTAGANR